MEKTVKGALNNGGKFAQKLGTSSTLAIKDERDGISYSFPNDKSIQNHLERKSINAGDVVEATLIFENVETQHKISVRSCIIKNDKAGCYSIKKCK